MATKYCFMNKERVCDLTCKAAFPVDDAVDPVDCYFIWLAANFGEGVFDMRRLLEANLSGGMPGPMGGGAPGETGTGPEAGPPPSDN
jgi:hypothetical protein